METDNLVRITGADSSYVDRRYTTSASSRSAGASNIDMMSNSDDQYGSPSGADRSHGIGILVELGL